MKKLLIGIAVLFETFAAFRFAPFGSFSFGWMGLAVFFASFLVD
jgi:hypothetical protein